MSDPMEASKSWNDGVKSGVCAVPHDEPGGYLSTAQGHPAYSWHELDPGFCVERGNSSRDVKRKPYKCGP